MTVWFREQKCLKALSEDRKWRRSCDVSRQVVPYRGAGRALSMCDCRLWIDEWSVRASDQSRTNAVVVVTAFLRHEWSRTGTGSNSVQRHEWLDMLKLPIWRRCAQGPIRAPSSTVFQKTVKIFSKFFLIGLHILIKTYWLSNMA